MPGDLQPRPGKARAPRRGSPRLAGVQPTGVATEWLARGRRDVGAKARRARVVLAALRRPAAGDRLSHRRGSVNPLAPLGVGSLRSP